MDIDVAIFTHELVTPEQFTAFLHSIGAVTEPSRHPKTTLVVATLSHDVHHVWIYHSPVILETTFEDLITEGATVLVTAVEQQLGGPARTCIMLNTSRDALPVRHLLVAFCKAFNQCWPSLFYRFEPEGFYNIEELQTQYNAL